ncbi:hypothetical protein [Helicobacter sp. T3_23-1056]
MCILCGELTQTLHWSEEAFETKTSKKSEMIVGQEAGTRAKARIKRVKILQKILGFYGLRIEDWQGSKFILRDKKGNTALVNNLADLWQSAQNLTNIRLNPLDSKLLQYLKDNA